MMKNILLIYTNYSTFVAVDNDILSGKHSVKRLQYKPVKGFLKTAFQFARQFFILLFSIWKYDVLYIWFADYHSFWPVFLGKFFNKKTYLVIGGYDVASMPELKYGSLASPLRKTLAVYSMNNATLCLPVVENLENKVREVAPKANTQTIYTGYRFESSENISFDEKRDEIVLSVSITNNRQRYLVKGLDRFRELAQLLPDYRFVVIGVLDEAKHLFDPIPHNLELLPPLPLNEVIEFYGKASFYAQLSRSEGLPNALCEAMLYGCIPIGTNVGGITAAIDKVGLVMNDWNAEIAAQFIFRNHNSPTRSLYKKYIETKFDIRFREEKLIELI